MKTTTVTQPSTKTGSGCKTVAQLFFLCENGDNTELSSLLSSVTRDLTSLRNANDDSLMSVAIAGRHISAVITLIQAGFDISDSASDYVASAAATGCFALFKLIVSATCVSNDDIMLFTSALQDACDAGHGDLVARLLGDAEVAAQVDLQEALLGAVYCGHTGVAARLLDAKASVDLPHLGSALLEAAACGCEAVVELVLGGGRAPDEGLLEAAVQGGCGGLLRRLLATGPHDADELGRSLCLAVEAGAEDAAQLLLGAGAAVDYRGAYDSPLTLALLTGDEGLAATLLDAGADASAREWARGRPMLALAAGKGLAGSTRLLLSRGADIDQVDDAGRTPLSHAWDADVARLLLDAKAAVRPAGGRSVLLAACEVGRYDTIALLLAAGASAGLDGDWAESPLALLVQHWPAGDAEATEKVAAAESLLAAVDADADPDSLRRGYGSVLHACARMQGDAAAEAIAALLLARDPGAVHHRESMTTPLFTAVGSNNTAMAAALLTAGARVGDRTAEDKTILMHTLVSNPAMYALLIEARADVSAESMDHGTVLTCVLRQASEQQAEYARAPTRMLLEATGDAQAVDSNGLTVIMSAAADPNIHPNVFDILMNCFVEVTGKT